MSIGFLANSCPCGVLFSLPDSSGNPYIFGTGGYLALWLACSLVLMSSKWLGLGGRYPSQYRSRIFGEEVGLPFSSQASGASINIKTVSRRFLMVSTVAPEEMVGIDVFTADLDVEGTTLRRFDWCS